MAISKLLLVWLAVSIALVGVRADSEAEEVVVEPVHSVSTLKLEIEHLRSQISHLESSISDKAKELKAKDDSISVLEKLVEEKTAAGVAALQTEVESLKVHRAWLPPWRAVQIARFKDLAAKEWNEHGKPTFDGILQKASEKSAQVQSWAEPHLETARTKWIPAVNEKWVTFTTTVSPHVQTLSTKSTEVYEVCRTAITPHFGKVQEFTAPSVQKWIPAVNEKWVTFTTTVSPHVQTVSTKSTEVYEVCRTAITPHLIKVQEFTAPSVQKWIPAVYEKWVTFTTTVSPHVQRLSTESTEVYEVCRTAITPHFGKVQEFTASSVQKWIPAVNEKGVNCTTAVCPHVQTVSTKSTEVSVVCRTAFTPHFVKKWIPAVNKKWVTFTTAVSLHVQTVSTKSTEVYMVCRTAITPHFVKVQEFIAPYVQVQDTVLEKLKSNEYTKPLATKERVWFMASALLAFPNFLLYRIFSTMFCKKTKKPSHAHASNAHCGPAC